MASAASVRGGLRLDAHKERSTRQPIRAASAAEMLAIALDQHAGAAAVPRVEPGATVLRGQPIAGPRDEPGTWLHAPVSGTVAAIETRPVPHRGGAPSLCVTLINDGRDADVEPTRRATDFEALAPEELGEHIGRGGIVGLGGAVFPTAAKLASARGRPGLQLLLNGVECEPYISCDDMLMRERAADVVLGARVLLHALSARRCTIAVEDDMPQAATALRAAIAAAHDERLELAVVPNVYPAGGERQLITMLYSVEVPSAGLPADVDVVCQNVATAAAIARWVRDGRPLISRIVTVTGDGVRAPGNLDAPLGTPLATLIADCGGYTERMAQLIMGGSMMGTALPHADLPVVKGTNCVIAASALDLTPRTAALPCIRCGECARVCPASLLPQQLHWYAQQPALGELQAHGLMDCIECGCCDYVCPSQIALTAGFRATKPALAARLSERTAADAARSRLAARTARLDQLEAARQAALAKKRPGGARRPDAQD